MSDRLLTIREVRAKVHMSMSWIYARIREGTFPSPIRLGFSARWPESEIDAWIVAQRTQRDEALAARRGSTAASSVSVGGAL